ncbi:MAG: sialidase domain-containing protein [Flavonifractor plautii]
MSDIPGINAGYLGKTARSGNQYPYNGSIENIKVFNTDIPDDTLTAWTLSGGF